MANFIPLKTYLLLLIDLMIEKYSMSGPFIDVGCGKGDVSLHFAKKGWEGKAIDISEEAIALTKNTLSKYTGHISIERNDPSRLNEKFNTIFLCDILEHEEDDDKLLESIKKISHKNTYLFISVPVFMSEWRWDDEFYGHLRRYEIPDLTRLLASKGFAMVEILDFTFPFFWFLRRLYTRIFPKIIISVMSRKDLSNKSSLQSSWDRGIFTTIVEKMLWWKPVFYLQSKFKNRLLGCECIFVAKYTGSD